MRKDLFRSIKKSLTRFISIVIIIALGISFFVGMKSASPDMKKTADDYFIRNNLMDIEVFSTIGFTDEEIARIADVDGVGAADGVKYADTLVFVDGIGIVNASNGAAMSCRVTGIDFDEAKRFSETGTADSTYINRIDLAEGNYPENAGECVVDYYAAQSYSQLAIGNEIMLSGDTYTLEDTFKTLSYKIVGYVTSPMYISSERGTTDIASGTLGMYLYIDENRFIDSNFTSAYVTIDYKSDYSVYSEDYRYAVEKTGKKIEETSEKSINARLSDIKDEYAKKIKSNQKKYNKLQKETTRQLKEAVAQINDIQNYINTGGDDIAAQKKQLESRVASAKKRLKYSKESYDASKKKYDSDSDEARDKGNQLNGSQKAKQIYNDYVSKQKADRKDIDNLKSNLSSYKNTSDSAKSAWDSAESSYQSTCNKIPSVETELKYAKDDLYQAQQEKNMWTEESSVSLDSIESKIRDCEQRCTRLNDELNSLYSKRSEQDSARNKAKEAYNKALSDYNGLEATIREREEIYAKNQQTLAGYADDIKRLQEGEEALTIFKSQLSQSKRALTASKIAITESQLRLHYEESTGQQKITAAEAELKAAKTRLETAEQNYDKIEHDVEVSLNKAQGDIDKAQLFLDELNSSAWYVYYQNDLPGHESYGQSLENINAVANVFPLIFFIIAAFMCLATMTRMVQEERMQLGTLKALGYSNGKMLLKYYYYAGFACIAGSIIGSAAGTLIFPKAVNSAYSMIYHLPSVKISFNWFYIVCGTVFALAVTLLATRRACRSELKVQAAHLMRPKAPAPGKRIFIERFATLWDKMSFGSIITMRNMFRSKKRMVMTILGVASSCTLILSAFGLSNSVDKIISAQYGDDGVSKYDLMVSLDEAQIPGESKVLKRIKEDLRVKKGMLIVSKTMSASSSDESDMTKTASHIVVPEDTEKISDFYLLRSRKSHKPITLDDSGAVISEKLAKDTGTKSGNTLLLKNASGKEYSVKVSGITENYLDHYIYISPAYYNEVFDETPEYKNIVLSLESYTVSGDEQNLADDLLSYNEVTGIASTDIMIESFNGVIDRLDVVIVIFIVTAGILALIILYNLTNISVQERLREIATIKVLGFTDSELTSYVYRENIFLTVAGIALGLIGGTVLHKIIIDIAEVNIAMFGREIYWWSYLLSIVMTSVFAASVCVLVHMRLKKLDSISSLKSVE